MTIDTSPLVVPQDLRDKCFAAHWRAANVIIVVADAVPAVARSAAQWTMRCLPHSFKEAVDAAVSLRTGLSSLSSRTLLLVWFFGFTLNDKNANLSTRSLVHRFKVCAAYFESLPARTMAKTVKGIP